MTRSDFRLRYIAMQADGGSKDISDRDLNEILTAGSYEGINCINSPVKGFIKLIVTFHTNSWIVQECEASNGDIYLRAYQNNIWYDWQKLDLEDDNDGEGVGITIQVVDRPHTHDVATSETKGFMSNIDKIKLDGIDDRANNYTHPLTHSADMIRETTDKKFISQELLDKIANIGDMAGQIETLTQQIELLESMNSNLAEQASALATRIEALEEALNNSNPTPPQEETTE